MSVLKAGWSPILIAALAVVGYIYEWPVEALVPAFGVIIVIGLVVAATDAREKKLARSSAGLKELAGYFSRRFAGDSSLSIFAIIGSLFNVDNPKIWDWARACDMSRRIFNTWCDSFVSRLESDVRTRQFTLYLRTYLNELWLMVSHYYEFVEQFYEVAGTVAMPRETIDQYNRFATEYNAFVQHFQDSIVELKKVARTEIEAPSVKLARELSGLKSPPSSQGREGEPSPPVQPGEHRGYIM